MPLIQVVHTKIGETWNCFSKIEPKKTTVYKKTIKLTSEAILVMEQNKYLPQIMCLCMIRYICFCLFLTFRTFNLQQYKLQKIRILCFFFWFCFLRLYFHEFLLYFSTSLVWLMEKNAPLFAFYYDMKCIQHTFTLFIYVYP